ncbi:prepilin peptidase [Arsenophonus nasoniae]|uniref:prepilin peptidase n=1 Tax=Arsenophonus nasoniae TaxID=638 RepID=UPI00387A1B5F
MATWLTTFSYWPLIQAFIITIILLPLSHLLINYLPLYLFNYRLKGSLSGCLLFITLFIPLSIIFLLISDFHHRVNLLFFVWFSVLLAFIDRHTGYLPDLLVYPLIVLALLFHAMQSNEQLLLAIYGALIGYLIFWFIYGFFKLAIKRRGLAQGDIKLVAAYGAWLGIYILPYLMLLSACLGLLNYVFLWIKIRYKPDKIAFGPALASAGISLMLIKYFKEDWIIKIIL